MKPSLGDDLVILYSLLGTKKGFLIYYGSKRNRESKKVIIYFLLGSIRKSTMSQGDMEEGLNKKETILKKMGDVFF